MNDSGLLAFETVVKGTTTLTGRDSVKLTVSELAFALARAATFSRAVATEGAGTTEWANEVPKHQWPFLELLTVSTDLDNRYQS
jgi:hypothetical protein